RHGDHLRATRPAGRDEPGRPATGSPRAVRAGRDALRSGEAPVHQPPWQAVEVVDRTPGGFGEIESVSPGRAARPVAASSVAPIALAIDAPCVLPTERASHPGDELHSAKPS